MGILAGSEHLFIGCEGEGLCRIRKQEYHTCQDSPAEHQEMDVLWTDLSSDLHCHHCYCGLANAKLMELVLIWIAITHTRNLDAIGEFKHPTASDSRR